MGRGRLALGCAVRRMGCGMPLFQCGMRPGEPATQRVRPGRSLNFSLFENCPAGIAEIGLLPPQACGDGPDIGNFAGAETIDVGGAGLFLLRRCQIRKRGSRCRQDDTKTERETDDGAARVDRKSAKSCLHDSIPLVRLAPMRRRCNGGEYAKNISPNVILLTLAPGRIGLFSHAGIDRSVTKPAAICRSIQFEQSAQSGNKRLLGPCALKLGERDERS